MIIGITKKINEKLGLEINRVPDILPIDINCWHANLFTWNRRNCLIFMNNRTRFLVLLYGVKKSDMKDLPIHFYNQLKTNLLNIGIEEIRINDYIGNNQEIYITKTTERSIIGSINDTILMIQYEIDNFYREGQLLQDEINNKINQYVMMPLSKIGLPPFPDKAMKIELEQN